MKRVLLTGGGGFVGANLARRLIREGHTVHLIVRPGHNPWRLEGMESVPCHEVDLSDAEALATTVRKVKPEWVFHLATYGAYPSQQDRDEMLRTNVTGTMNLVEACLDEGFESFVNTGSSSEYGFKDHAPRESEVINPNSEYALTKAMATQYCGLVARRRSVPIRTLRLYSVYGPWEEPSRLVPALVVSGLHGTLPPLAGRDVARDFVHVDDVCDAYLAAASNAAADDDSIFNIGSGVQSTLGAMVDCITALMKLDVTPQWGSMPNRTWDTNIWVADNRRARDVLQWAPRITLQSGLAATIDWLRADPGRLALYESPAPVRS